VRAHLGRRLAVTLALGVVTLALLLPVGAMLVSSLIVHEVVLEDGRVLTAVGDVDRSDGRYVFSIQPDGEKERVPLRLPEAQVHEVRTRVSFHHYGVVLGDARTRGLVLHSLLVAGGGMLMALLFGLPVAWLLFRTDLPGRRVALALCLGPVILPPLFVTMGAARPIMNAITAVFGFEGGTLQVSSAMLVFGCVLFPLIVVLVGRALAAVPAGAVEAARLLGGRGAALRRVVLPAVAPATFGAAALVFVLAWADFTVPDVLGFTLPAGASPVYFFPTDILLQWKQNAAPARAVATGVPFLLLTGLLLLVAIFFLRRSPVIAGGEGRLGRPLVRLRARGRVLGWCGIVLLLLVSLVLPLVGVGSWARGHGETVAQPGQGLPEAPTSSRTGALFDFAGALDRTPGSREDLERWIKTGLGAAVLAMAVALVLARWALTGGRLARGVVLFLALLPLAVPGLVFTVGTNLLWTKLSVGWVERGVLRSVLVLTARFLPFAILSAWLALREVRRGHEEAAALLGAGPATRAWRIWGALSWRGILAGGLAVLVLALREVDAIISLDDRIFPLRIYQKIHFSRLADEANLSFMYVGILLAPALVAAVVLGLRRRR